MFAFLDAIICIKNDIYRFVTLSQFFLSAFFKQNVNKFYTNFEFYNHLFQDHA